MEVTVFRHQEEKLSGQTMNKPNSSSYLPLTVRSSIGGSIVLPASKSITIRALLLASLGEGEIKIDNSLVSEDTNFFSFGFC